MQINPINQNSNQIRLLYLADIQGPGLIAKRGIERNLSFAGTAKVFGICQSMLIAGFHVRIFSPGSPAEKTGRYYSKTNEKIIDQFGVIDIEYGASMDDRIGRFLFSIFGALVTVPKIIKNNAIELVVIYNLSTTNILSALVARILGCKVYLDYEDGVTASRTTQHSAVRSFLLSYEWLAKKVVSGVIGASKELASRINVENSMVIPGILDEGTLQHAKGLPKSLWTLDRALRIIYAGGMDESKGIDRFLMALQNVVLDYEVELVVCGHGPMSKKVSDLCQQNIQGMRIRFLGVVSREELINCLCWADVGINPHRSDFHKGGSWPFKVAEYLALCGTVFSNRTNKISPELEKRLWLYEGDEVGSITFALQSFLKDWPLISIGSNERREWAISEFSARTLSLRLKYFLRQFD
jgi:glycosyltransferase involved in cell wall biosynthesis